MTQDEANKIAEIIACADGGCSNCVTELVELARQQFPEIEWIIDKDGNCWSRDWAGTKTRLVTANVRGARSMSEWRDIQTAPHDDSLFIGIRVSREQTPSFYLLRWHPRNDRPEDSEGFGSKATHWMSLPEPPTEAAKD